MIKRAIQVFSVAVMLIIGPANLMGQSSKEKYDALNDFFEARQLKNRNLVLVIQEKIETSITLEMLRCSSVFYGVDLRGLPVIKGPAFHIQKKHFKSIHNQKKIEETKKETAFWTAKDFRQIKVILETRGCKPDSLFDEYNKILEIYYFSEPVHYKKYIVFAVEESSMIAGGSSRFVVFMKKNKKGKWVYQYRANGCYDEILS